MNKLITILFECEACGKKAHTHEKDEVWFHIKELHFSNNPTLCD